MAGECGEREVVTVTQGYRNIKMGRGHMWLLCELKANVIPILLLGMVGERTVGFFLFCPIGSAIPNNLHVQLK